MRRPIRSLTFSAKKIATTIPVPELRNFLVQTKMKRVCYMWGFHRIPKLQNDQGNTNCLKGFFKPPRKVKYPLLDRDHRQFSLMARVISALESTALPCLGSVSITFCTAIDKRLTGSGQESTVHARASSLIMLLQRTIFFTPQGFFPDVQRTTKPQSVGEEKLPVPVPPHLYFEYRRFSQEKISCENNFLMFGGTISCCAAQLAYLMGASKINLFGCEFSHQDGSYFRKFSHIGAVNDDQRIVMETMLQGLRERGVTVVAFGNTKLTEVDRFES